MRNHLQMGYPTDRGLFSSHPGNLTSTARSLGWSRDSSENGRYPLNGYSTCWTNMGKHWWTSGWNGVHTPFSDKAKLGMLEIWDVDTRRRSLFKNKSNIRHMRMCRKKKKVGPHIGLKRMGPHIMARQCKTCFSNIFFSILWPTSFGAILSRPNLWCLIQWFDPKTSPTLQVLIVRWNHQCYLTN